MAAQIGKPDHDVVEGALLVPSHVERYLPAMVRAELSRLPSIKQCEFVEEFERKSKSLPIAYIFAVFLLHYAYLGRWGLLILMWMGSIFLLGIGLIWLLIDLFRMPGLVRNYNGDVAINVMRNLKAIG